MILKGDKEGFLCVFEDTKCGQWRAYGHTLGNWTWNGARSMGARGSFVGQGGARGGTA